MILAGGQSLIAMMNMRIAKPKILIDINTIKDEGNILLLSHSTGANDLINDYKSLPNDINKKAIMIDPLDFQKSNQNLKKKKYLKNSN